MCQEGAEAAFGVVQEMDAHAAEHHGRLAEAPAVAGMRFSYRPLPALPLLAWCAVIERGTGSVTVLHGERIHTEETRFVEGAWSGEFSSSFAAARTFTGTGAELRSGSVCFATPTHTLHAIYAARRADRLYFANSLPFLLAACGDDLRLDYVYYHHDLMSVMDGLDRYARHIPTRGGSIDIYYYANVTVGPDLAVSTEWKADAPPFGTYQEYVSHLRSEVRQCFANAADSRRRWAYEPIATVSTGYDSPATAVVARNAGCRRALTFAKANEKAGEQADSGREIAGILGLPITEFDAKAYLSRSDERDIEIEFSATGLGADDLPFASAEEVLHGALVVTGYQGGKVWSRIDDRVGRELSRRDPSGGSLAEFRLRIGMQVFPVAFIGAREFPTIHAIANSPEFERWSLKGTSYDKPVARRIVEEAGVPREMFGMAKKAVARPYHTTGYRNPDLELSFSPAALRDFRTWAARAGVAAGPRTRLAHRLLSGCFHLTRSMPGLWRLQPYLKRYAKPISEHDFVFAWACERMRDRYLAALRAAPEPPLRQA